MECRHESIDGARVELHRPCDSVPAANSGFRLAGQRLRSPHEGLLVLFHAGRVWIAIGDRNLDLSNFQKPGKTELQLNDVTGRATR